MGGTNPNNILNTLTRDEETEKDDNILLWNCKVKIYLIDLGLTYTIINLGGLINEEGGRCELVVNVDDP